MVERNIPMVESNIPMVEGNFPMVEANFPLEYSSFPFEYRSFTAVEDVYSPERCCVIKTVGTGLTVFPEASKRR